LQQGDKRAVELTYIPVTERAKKGNAEFNAYFSLFPTKLKKMKPCGIEIWGG
jgi:hypothetical protein